MNLLLEGAPYPINFDEDLDVDVDCTCEFEDVLGPGYPLMRVSSPTFCRQCGGMETEPVFGYDPDMREEDICPEEKHQK